MREIVRRLPLLRANHPAMRRDQLLLALGWATALRASELVALDVDDLRFVGDPTHGGRVLVRIRRSKTDQTGRTEYVVVPFATHFSVCPAMMARRWCTPDDPGRCSGPLIVMADPAGGSGSTPSPVTSCAR